LFTRASLKSFQRSSLPRWQLSRYLVEPKTVPTLDHLLTRNPAPEFTHLVADAVSKGAKVLTGGEVPSGDGYFYPPTVLANVPANAEILKEEIFGPVAPVITFKTEDEAVALANSTEYGLIAYAFTENLNRGLRLAERLEVGMFGLNAGVISNPAAPFGGVKSSGLGREGGFEGIEEYLETVYVGIADPMVS
jgi:succinate-semialdehyde dehydrogenase / glutarate-semialdehyde dehydrogenase